jgi:hypothetical protein
MKKYLLLGICNPGETVETLVKLEIEEYNRDDVLEVINDAVTLIYDGIDFEEGENE